MQSSSMKIDEKREALKALGFVRTRSVCSDEHLHKKSPTIDDHSKVVELVKTGDKDSSPKFLLSLRQLEKLLFST